MSIEKFAVCVFLYSPRNNKVLASSRKYDHSDFGLPGGKVEADEMPTFAACREVMEETGYVLHDLAPFFIQKEASSGYLTTTFLPRVATEELDHMIENLETVEPQEGEGLVRWVSPEILVESSSFSEYNLKLMRLLWSTKYVPFNIDDLLGQNEVDFEISRVQDFRLLNKEE